MNNVITFVFGWSSIICLLVALFVKFKKRGILEANDHKIDFKISIFISACCGLIAIAGIPLSSKSRYVNEHCRYEMWVEHEYAFLMHLCAKEYKTDNRWVYVEDVFGITDKALKKEIAYIIDRKENKKIYLTTY